MTYQLCQHCGENILYVAISGVWYHYDGDGSYTRTCKPTYAEPKGD